MANKAKITNMDQKQLEPKWPKRQIDQNYQNGKDFQKSQQVEIGKNGQLTSRTK